MRYAAFWGTALFLLASTAHAQMSSGTTLAAVSPMPAFALPANPEPAPEPQGVYGVLQNFNWQAYAGFTHFTFYELPGTTGQLNGFNFGLAYYPHGGHLAGEGEFDAAFAPQAGVNTHIAIVMGGVRYRFDVGRGLEVWAHGMVGGAHFSPRTAFGGQDALAGDLGAGADFNLHHSHLGLRGQVDWVPTHFFGTHQYNIKESIGLVYRF